MIQYQPIPAHIRRRRFIIGLIAISIVAGVVGALLAIGWRAL